MNKRQEATDFSGLVFLPNFSPKTFLAAKQRHSNHHMIVSISLPRQIQISTVSAIL